MVLRGLLEKMLILAASMAVMVFGVTEWLKYEWENAPTHYPDGSVMYPDGRVVHADGRVEQRMQRIVHADGRVEYREWRGRGKAARVAGHGNAKSGKW